MRSGLEETEACCKEKEISPEGAGEEGVEKRVGAGVDGIKEDQQEFGVWDGDEGELQGGGDGKEGDGRHADKVGEDEDGHALGHAGVGVGRRRRGVADGQVDAEVTGAHAEEGQNVEDEERDHVDLRGQLLHVHGQADTDLQHRQQADANQWTQAAGLFTQHDVG